MQKMLLKLGLVYPVIVEICGEGVVVGIGKGIRGIVDQLAQGVIIKQIHGILLLQPLGDPAHKVPGVAVIVPTEPLKMQGAFQICSRIPVRLDTAD